MDSDGHVIEAAGLCRGYRGGFEAVSGITFTVGRGELFALLGTNGAGKSPTVELPEGLATPSTGAVRSSATTRTANGRRLGPDRGPSSRRPHCPSSPRRPPERWQCQCQWQ
ncbi:hypothetical protein SSP531S_54680 [Streptomyces spongiicola]|uniref:ABC transporter domain-containing protein n=1 Tax=Streptomyces spongiicola TaxID=1690221 RepID=A0A388T7D6_9ACTN|nr:hypothetical protein SSP531S_54680 [Streptomyces spongiicola]